MGERLKRISDVIIRKCFVFRVYAQKDFHKLIMKHFGASDEDILYFPSVFTLQTLNDASADIVFMHPKNLWPLFVSINY